MAQVYKFFNSGVGDPREYEASDFADYFGSLLSTGILSTTEILGMSASVEAGTLNTIVTAGKSIMKGHMYENTSPLTLTHSIPEASLDRIDRIVLRLDLRNAERNILLKVKEGDPSASPVAPILQRDNFIYEISMAQIRVRKNTVQLLPADLVDERLNEDLCGLVTWTPKVPTDQFQKQWDDFMNGVIKDGFVPTSDYVKAPGYAHTTNAGNAYSITLNPVPAQYKDGMGIVVTINLDSTGPATINVNGLGAKSIVKPNGQAVSNLKKNGIYPFRYNATTGNFIEQGGGGEDLTALIKITNEAELNVDTIRANVATALTGIGTPSGPTETWVSLTNKIKLIKPVKVEGGDTWIASSLARKNSVGTPPTVVKRLIWLGPPGQVYFRFNLGSTSGTALGVGVIWINGIAAGSVQQSNSITGQWMYDLLNVKTGDVVELKINSNLDSYTAFVDNFSIGLADLGLTQFTLN